MRIFFLFFLFFQFCFSDILLLKTYENQNIDGWLMSEKLDGVRAIWNGKKLISRQGNELFAPSWFIKDFPPFKLDGELWSKRGDFENINSITSKLKANEGWRQLSYNVFEIPEINGTFKERLEVLKTYVKKNNPKYLHIIEQKVCKNKEELHKFLKEVEQKGGEGVVIRDPNAKYIAKRTNKVLKVKSFQDDECKVIAHNKGSGKYKNMLGSITCENKNGIKFKIGSGFSDEQRKNPPKINSIITYKFQGLTKNKKPRFAVFLRQRNER